MATADLRSAARSASKHPARVIVAAILLPVVGGPTTFAAVSAGALIEIFARNLAEPIFVAAFTASALFILLFGPPATIATFFTDRRLLLLISSPVSVAQVYNARLMTGLGAYLLVAWPLLMLVSGYGMAAHAGIGYLAAALLIVLAWLLGIVGIQVAGLSLLLRAIPARLVRDSVVIGGALLAAGAAVLQLSLAGLGTSSVRPPSLDALSQGGSGLPAATRALDWLPAVWPARALIRLGAMDYGGGLAWMALLLTVATVCVIAGGAGYSRSFAAGAAVFGEGGSQLGRRQRPARNGRAATAGPAAPLRAMLTKDWIGLRRDVRRLSGVIPGLIFGVGYPLLLSPGATGGGADGFDFGIRLFAVSTFPLMLASTLGVAAIAGEGRAFLLLVSSPRSPWWLVRSKLAFAAPPVVAGGAIVSAVVLLAHGTDPATSLACAVFVGWLGAGFATVSVAGGAIWSSFQDGPTAGRMSLDGVVMVLVGSFSHGALSAAGLVAIIFATRTEGPAAMLLLTASLVAFVAAAVVCIAFLRGAVARLSRLEPGS